MSDENVNKKSRLRSGLSIALLIVIIMLQLTYTIYCYSVKKIGMYGDEIWSYGLANSYYQPFIFIEDGPSAVTATGDQRINFFEWVDGSVFEEYITVQPNERFAYGSVYHNQTLDFHPPLYYAVLHTVCSFFPNSFSFLYAFVLNCIFLVVTQLYFYRLGRLITKDKWKPLLMCVLYGAGSGALSTFIYLRQYSLLTMLVVMHAYYAARVYYSGGKELKKLLPLIFTALAAFLTHYYGIVYVGLLTAFMCIYFLCRKRIKAMLTYGLSMLLTLGVFFAVFPAFFTHVTQEEYSFDHALDYSQQIRMAFNMLFRPTIGVGVSIYKSAVGSYIIAAAVLVSVLLIAPVCFIFRKDNWFIKVKGKVLGYFGGIAKTVKQSEKNFFPLFIALTMLAATFFLNWQVNFYYYQTLAMRYLFFLYPSVCLSVFYFADLLIGLIIPVLKKHSTKIMAALCIVMIAFTGQCHYFFPGTAKHDEVRDALAGKNCVLIIEGKSQLNLLSSFPSYFGKTEHVFVTMSAFLEETMANIKNSEYADDIDYLIVPSSEYFLSDEQYDRLKEISAERGYDEFEKLSFFTEEVYDEMVKKGSSDGSEKPLTVSKVDQYMEAVESFCPRDEYIPDNIINVNNWHFILLAKKQ